MEQKQFTSTTLAQPTAEIEVARQFDTHGETVFSGGNCVVLVAFTLALPLALILPLPLALPLALLVVTVSVTWPLPLLLALGVGVDEASGNVDGGIADCARALDARERSVAVIIVFIEMYISTRIRSSL